MGRVGIGTVGLVANPRAGRGLASRAADRAVARLTERGVSVVADGFTITTDLGRITADDGTSRWFGTVLDAPVTLTAFGNTRSYGGGMAICPSPSRRCRRSAATSCRGPDPASTAAPVHDWIRREYFGGGG